MHCGCNGCSLFTSFEAGLVQFGLAAADWQLALTPFSPTCAILVGSPSYPCPVTTHPAALSRRTLLTTAAVLSVGLVAACSSSGSSSNPDDSVKAAVAAAEQQLIDLYDAALSAFPDLRPTLQPIRSQHAEHLAAVGGTPTESGESAALGATTATAALRELASQERRASGQRVSACVDANASELAWVLSLIGASESQHAAALAGATA